MQIKVVKPINFLFFRVETDITGLEKFLPVGQELFREAVQLKLPITGPVHWHYFEFDGDPSKNFTLEVALPVAEISEEYDGKFHFKRTEAFKCVTEIHEGSWESIPESYGKIMQFMGQNDLKPMPKNREIYVNVDFRHPEANVTEIQVGIN